MAGGYVADSNVLEKDHFARPFRAWLVVIVAALFFFYEFIQMNMFNAISGHLLIAFNIDATQLGTMSSYYFIANVVFLFLAGFLLDRFSTKVIIVVSMLICIAGTAFFALSQSFAMATLFRFFTGIGSAFCFLSCIRLASRWFPAKRMGLVIGWIVTMAMIGGTVAQTPLTLLVQVVHWRNALFLDAALGLILLLIIGLVVEDYPPLLKKEEQLEHSQLDQIGYLKSFKLAFLRLNNWLGAIYTCTMNLPLILLGGLWSNLYLKNVHHLTNVQASTVASMLFIGTIIGSPIAGWFSDKIQRRRSPMLLGAVLGLIVVSLTILLPHLHYKSMLVLFFAIGFITSTQIIGYPYVSESSPRMITATSVSVVNIATQGGVALFQPVYGFLIDLHAKDFHFAVKGYNASDFHWAMLIFPAGMIVAILVAFFIKETYGKSLELREQDASS